MGMTDGMNCWPDVAPPQITTASGPVNSVLGFTVASGPFISSAQLLGSVDLEIRTAPKGGGTLAYSSLNNLSVLSVIVPTGILSGLQTGQTYYLRTRFKALNGMYSDWSADVAVTT